MAGHRPFREFTKNWSEERKRLVREEVAVLKQEMERLQQRGEIPSPCEGEGDSPSVESPSGSP